MGAVAVLFKAGPSELGIEPDSEKAHNEYLFQGEEEEKGDMGKRQGHRKGWGSPGKCGVAGIRSRLHWGETPDQASRGQSWTTGCR